MIEKTSKNIKCKLCGAPATTVIGVNPYCDNCAKDAQVINEEQELIEIFEG